MNKEYRDMTAEERLRVINAAMNKDGFVELKRIIDEFEKILLSGNVVEKPRKVNRGHISEIREIIKNEGLAGFAGYQNNPPQEPPIEYKSMTPNNPNPEQGSIYASEHRDLAMEENQVGQTFTETTLLEQPRRRVLEHATPNPWGDAEVVTPGQLKL